MISSHQQNQVTSEAYDTKYKEGYGLQYPDGHVIRFHRYILQHELNMKGGKILDYGCGNGVHSQFFENHGYTPYGCDTSETAIQLCKKRLSRYANNFHVTPIKPNMKEFFTEKFDVIFSNQVLYFFNDEDLSQMLQQFHSMMNDNAVIFATMMGPENLYSRYVKGQENGMSRVELYNERLHEVNYINFKTDKEVLNTFTKDGYFKKLHLGWYTCLIREQEGRSDHWIFVGQKI